MSEAGRDVVPSVSVVIVTFNSADVIRDCMDSVASSVADGLAEVIVVDNMSGDGTADLVVREFPWATLVDPGANLGYSAGNNLGASEARGRYLLLLNPDTVVREGAIERLADALSGDETLWAVGPCITGADGAPGHAWGDLPSLWWALTDRGPLGHLGFRSKRRIARVGDCESDRDVGFVTGASMMTRADVWGRLGGLDEDYFLYFEDVDYCSRVRRAGGRVRLISGPTVVHLDGTSFADAPRARQTRSQQGLVLYLAKHSSKLAAQTFRATIVLERLVYLAASFLPGRRFDALRRNREEHMQAVRAFTRRGMTRKTPRTL